MLTEVFGKCPQVKTINYLLAHPFHKYTKKEIAQGSEISRITLDKFIEDFLELGLLEKENGLYLLNKESYLVQLMDKLQESLADMEGEKQKDRFLKTPTLSDEELDDFLDLGNVEFDEKEELILVDKKELERLIELEKKYNNYAEKQKELTIELLNNTKLTH